jgi:hypothetical protein
MHVHDRIVGELHEQVFTHCLGLDKGRVIDACGTVSKATLWAGHGQSLPGKCLVEVFSIAVNRVTFRHDNDN